MDALSSVLVDIHLKQANFATIQLTSDYRLEPLVPKQTMVFYIVISGELKLQLRSSELPASTGDMLMMPQGSAPVIKCGSGERVQKLDLSQVTSSTSLHHVGAGTPCAQLLIAWCEYDQGMARPLLSALPEVLPERPVGDDGLPVILSKVTEQMGLGGMIHSEILRLGLAYLAVEVRSERLGQATMLNRLCSMLMVECLREHIEGLSEESTSWLMALKDRHLAKAISALHSDPAHNWTISSLAEIAGMSRSSFAERFRQIMDDTPLGYLTDYRLRIAARYLRLGQYSVGQISALVGYASDSTFSQAFKRAYGLSPMQFRKSLADD